MANSIKLKDYFGAELALLLAGKIAAVHQGFNTPSFVDRIEKGIPDLQLKARVALIANELKYHLMVDKDYPEAIGVLLRILGPENPKETGMFKQGYWLMPVAKFVELFGLGHYGISMQAIGEITKRHTGEYAVRPYVEKNPHQSLAQMKKWARDTNVHVRRLASEGLRPRLPWARKLDMFIENPSPIIDVIGALKTDRSAFVKKSVANNMNDILKDNYELGMRVLQQWSTIGDPNTKWIVRHALRNRVKQGDPQALAIIASR